MKQVSICLRAFALLLLGLVWLAGTIPAHAAATLTVLHTLNPSTEGNQPEGGLVQGPDGSLYGVTYNGTNIAFQLTPDGTFHILHKFDTYSDGQQLFAKLLLIGNQLFGTCAFGGGNDISQSQGTIFVIDLSKISPADNAAGFGLLHTFGDGGTTADGSNPYGVLTLAADGNLYGTTYAGGAAGLGTVFQLKPDASGQFSYTIQHALFGPDTYVFNGTYTKLYDFSGSAASGTSPFGGVIQGPGGFLYGTTDQGGLKNCGTVYKVARDGTGFTLLHAFTGGNKFDGTPMGDGMGSRGELLFAVDGNFYGTTSSGGTGNAGTVFQLKPGTGGDFAANGPFQTLHNFVGATDGSQLLNGVIQASDGSLVGTTYGGGLNGSGSGTAFTIASINGQFSSACPFSLLYSFDSSLGSPRTIFAPLIQGLDGRLHGESTRGGQLADTNTTGGTVFALDAGLEAPPIVGGVTGPGGLAVTTTDTSLVISGTHFANNFTNQPVVRVDGVPVTTTARDYSKPIQKITVTLPTTLAFGNHNVTVGTSAPFAFSVGKGVAAPAITLLDYTPGQTKLLIHGSGFTSSDLINVTFVAPGGTITSFVVNDPTLATVTLSAPLPFGPHTIMVTDSDTQLSASKQLVVLGIKSVDYTAGDSVFTVHGGGFSLLVSVSIDKAPGIFLAKSVTNQHGTSQTYETIALTLTKNDGQGNPQPISLPAGDHTITVTNPDGATATFILQVAQVVAAPTISSVGNVLFNGTQSRLIINGNNFVLGTTVKVTPFDTSVVLGTPTHSFNSVNQMTETFAAKLPAGYYAVRVTNHPDGQDDVFFLLVPGITSIDYTAGATTVTIHGIGFATDANVSIGDPSNGNIILPLDITDGSQIVVTLLNPLPPGTHSFTVTNPDGQTESASIVVDEPVKTLQPTIDNSKTVGGFTITPGGAGFSGSIHIIQMNPDPNSLPSAAAPAATRVSAKSSRVGTRVATTTNYPVIYDMTADTTFDADLGYLPTYIIIKGSGFDAADTDALTTVTVDGVVYSNSVYHRVSVNDANTIVLLLNKTILDTKEHSLFVTNPNGHSSQTKSFGIVNGRFVNGKFFRTPFTSYNVNVQNAPLSGPGTTVGATGQSPLGGPYQKVAFGVSNNLISQDGGGLIGPDGASIVAAGGGNFVALPSALISQDGGGVISNDGGTILAKLISQDGGGLIGKDGGRVISNDGGSVISNDGGSAISKSGGSLVGGGNVVTGASLTSTSSRVFSRRSAALTSAPTTGYMDVTLFVSKAGQGIRLLVTRYTPGERDLILYKDPSVTVTPNPGTPAPLAANAGVTVTRGPVTSDHHTHQPYQVLTLTNTGAATLSGPVLVALTGLPAGVTVSGSAGIVASSPAVTASGSGLAPGASVKVRVDFSDPTNIRFSYGTAVYAGL